MANGKPIIYIDWVVREMLRENPDSYFVFGDNVARKGFGGQAKEMRGEPNAIGIATKFLPSMGPKAFFSDDNQDAWMHVSSDLMKLIGIWTTGAQIFAPYNGLGTERAKLKEKAPRIYVHINEVFEDMSGDNFPWESMRKTR